MKPKVGDVVKFKATKGLREAIKIYGTFGIDEKFIYEVAGTRTKVKATGNEGKIRWVEVDGDCFSWPWWFFVEKESKKK